MHYYTPVVRVRSGRRDVTAVARARESERTGRSLQHDLLEESGHEYVAGTVL